MLGGAQVEALRVRLYKAMKSSNLDPLN